MRGNPNRILTQTKRGILTGSVIITKMGSHLQFTNEMRTRVRTLFIKEDEEIYSARLRRGGRVRTFYYHIDWLQYDFPKRKKICVKLFQENQNGTN